MDQNEGQTTNVCLDCIGEFCLSCIDLTRQCHTTKDQCDLSLKPYLMKWAYYDPVQIMNGSDIDKMSPAQVSRLAMWALENRLFFIAFKLLSSPKCDPLTFHGFASEKWVHTQHCEVSNVFAIKKFGPVFGFERHIVLKRFARARAAALYVIFALRPIVSHDISRVIGICVYATRHDLSWD